MSPQDAYRRRRFEASHRRPGLLRVLWRPIANATLTVGVPVAIVIWSLTSPRFHLQKLEVQVGERVQEVWVHRALAPLRGRSLWLTPLEDIEARVLRHPWIAGAEIHKALPDGLSVRITERVPVALLDREGELLYVDQYGKAIDVYAPETDSRAYWVVRGANDRADVVARALDAAAQLADHGAGLGTVEEVEILNSEDLRVLSSDLPFPLLVSVGRMTQALAKMRRFLPEVLRRYDELAVLDLRFSRQIVIQLPEA